MNTFADLKRAIKPGVRMEVLDHEYRPELNGSIRTVTRVQTNGYWFNTTGYNAVVKDRQDPNAEFWSGFAKASCYSFPSPDTYRQDEGAPGPNQQQRRLAWTCRILPEAS